MIVGFLQGKKKVCVKTKKMPPAPFLPRRSIPFRGLSFLHKYKPTPSIPSLRFSYAL